MDICFDTSSLQILDADVRTRLQALALAGKCRVVVAQKVLTEFVDGASVEYLKRRITACRSFAEAMSHSFFLAEENAAILLLEKQKRTIPCVPTISSEHTIIILKELEAVASRESGAIEELKKYSARADKVRVQAEAKKLREQISRDFKVGLIQSSGIEQVYDTTFSDGGLNQMILGDYAWVCERLGRGYRVGNLKPDPIKRRCLMTHGAYFFRNMLASAQQDAHELMRKAGSTGHSFGAFFEYHENDEYDAAIAAIYAYGSIVVSEDAKFRTIFGKIVSDCFTKTGIPGPELKSVSELRVWLNNP